MIEQLLKQVNDRTNEFTFTLLGVALLLMLPRNVFSLPYWIALSMWIVTDYFSEHSRLEQLSTLL